MEPGSNTESRFARRGAIKLAAAYFVITTIWILGSDHLAAIIAANSAQLHFIQSIKGILFVAMMTLVVGLSAARLLRSEAARQRAQVLSCTDPITRLPNAHAFYGALAEELAGKAVRAGILVIDLRDFSRVNATFGRHAGDQALFNIGRRLQSLATEKAQVARLEEDKFAVLLPSAGADETAAFARQVLEGFRSEMRVAGQSVALDINLGFAICPDDGDHVAGLLDAADLALRSAKLTGNNTAQRFQPELLQSRRETFHLEAELRQALVDNALAIHLQPQYSLADGALIGAEALVRWTHPQRGAISPAVFIPVAEQSGLIDRVGEYVLHRACQAMNDWREKGLPELRVAINVAGHQLDDSRLSFLLMQAAEEWAVPMTSMEIEITETMAMRDPERAIEVLSQLRQLGVTVALDDFGTGYSSLSYLLQLPVDKLKIDRSFIAGLDTHRQQRSFVRTLIELGRELGMQVVAEGIETESQCELLRELGCDLGQGYLLGRPMNISEFSRLLSTRPVYRFTR